MTAHTTAKIAPSLQDSLLVAVDALGRRRACDIPEQTIAAWSHSAGCAGAPARCA